MNIKSIKKIGSDKYQIILNDNVKITTYDEVLLKNNLLYKKELTADEINEINKANGYYNIYSNLVKYINKKMRSEKEINEYLNKYELSISDKENLIKGLKNNGFINDIRFVKAYISDRLYLSNDGPNKIKNDLLKHNIEEEQIDIELCGINDEEFLNKLSKLVNKKLKSAKGSAYNVKQKVYYDMYNLGYSKEMVDSVFDINLDDSSSLEKDFNKVYNDLIKKEKDEGKLHLKLKQKLYQKGYSLDKIDAIISKKRY